MGSMGRGIGDGLEALGKALLGFGNTMVDSQTKERERAQAIEDQKKLAEHKQKLTDESPVTASLIGVRDAQADRYGRMPVGPGVKMPPVLSTNAGKNAGALAIADLQAQGKDITRYIENPALVVELPSFQAHLKAQTAKNAGLSATIDSILNPNTPIPQVGAPAPEAPNAYEQVGAATQGPPKPKAPAPATVAAGQPQYEYKTVNGVQMRRRIQ